MGKLSALLILLLTILFLGNSSQLKKKESEAEINQNLYQSEQDTLLEWMTFMKDESRKYRDAGDIDQALLYLTRCIDTRWREPSNFEEYEKLAWIFVNRGYLYHKIQGDFLAAKEDYIAALKHFESCEPSPYLVGRFVYQPLGNIFTRLGENEIAISMLEKFMRACKEANETSSLMSAYNDIGRAYLNSYQFEQAISWVLKGIELDDSDDFSLGLLYSTKAETEWVNKEFDASAISSQKCIEHVDKFLRITNEDDYRYLLALEYKIVGLTAKAKVLGHRGRLTDAHKTYEEVIALTKEVYPVKHRARARALVELGNSHHALKEDMDALHCYQWSLRSMLEEDRVQNFFEDPPITDLFADVVFGEALLQKGKVAHALFRNNKDESWLKISVNAYLTYFDWVEIQRSEQFEFDSKLGTAKEIHKTGESALHALFDYYSVTKESKWIDTAFALMDQTKAIVLAEERGLKDLAKRNPEMGKMLKELSALKFQRSRFKVDIQEAEQDGSGEDVVRLKKRLSELDQQSQLLDQEIRSLFPSYRTQASSKIEGMALERLRSKLAERNTSMISYFVGEEQVYVISGSPMYFKFNQFEREILTTRVDSFLVELNNPTTSTPELYSKTGKALFDLLIGERSKKLRPNWVILPDGILNSLPFEALLPAESKSPKSFKKMKYLLRYHVIHYSPSAYFYVMDGLRNEAKKSFLGIAPVFKNSTEYDFLPKSIEELHLGASLFSGKELTEENATKEQFFKYAEQYNILHISTHAGSNSGDNNDAWMAFSDAKSNDSRMVATELLKLDLPANLVVLNACETGSGTVFKGEGPMSLARGFLNAGSRSTLTNLWRVNHESNAVIMKRFYQNLRKTESPSHSLKAAKLDYLGSGDIDEMSAHPYFWSSSILVGTDVSVEAPSSDNPFLFPFVLLIFLPIAALFFFLFWKAWVRMRDRNRLTQN